MERLFIEETSTIYVGMPHSRKWSESGNPLEPVLCSLKDAHGTLYTFKLWRCPDSRKLYLPAKTYQKHWFRFKTYRFLNTKTGRPTSEMLICQREPSEGFLRATPSRTEAYPTPAYIVQGLRHPFQGGGCCGR